MLPPFQDLQQRARDGRPVRVGIVGTGFFGAGVVRQLHKVIGMEPAIVAARNPEKAVAALRSAGIEPERIVLCSQPGEGEPGPEPGPLRRDIRHRATGSPT